MLGHLLIGPQWVEGKGPQMWSYNPATQAILWQGNSASLEQIDAAIQAAKHAFSSWSRLSFEERLSFLTEFNRILEMNRQSLADCLSQETGKPAWEAKTEIDSMIHKLAISVQAYQERCQTWQRVTSAGTLALNHRPHGIIAVLGPFNFPLHLPHGHIIPALLAGNTVVFKASELTPWVAEKMVEYWQQAKLPAGVLNLIQGSKEVGQALAFHPQLDGLFFTGSYQTGRLLSEHFTKTPQKILALEMGGNNPLVLHKVAAALQAAVYHTLQSAYLTAGQRCTCARRLIVTKNPEGEAFVQALRQAITQLQVGPYDQKPEPFMGPVISKQAQEHLLQAYAGLVKQGGVPLVLLTPLGNKGAFLSPSLIDVTDVEHRRDEELFGPILQLIWVKDFEEALQEANNTAYGLSAGLLCEDKKLFQRFSGEVKAGLINWNRPLTGASAQAPFGGIGNSGNHRPAAYYAADYCAYPVASLKEEILTLPEKLPPGLSLKI